MEKTKRKTTISFLTFNTFGRPLFAPKTKQRYKKIAKTVTESGIDIACFQEVSTYYHLSLLKKYLPDYPYCGYKKFIYGPKGGVVIFSKLPFEETSYTSYSSLGGFKNISLYSHLLRNGMLVCKLKDMPLYIINTHLTTDFEFKWSAQNRFYNFVRLQVEEAAVLMNELAKDYAVIMAGDFNMAKDAALYLTLLETTNAKDLFQKFSFPTYHNDRLTHRLIGKTSDRIDFVFLKQEKEKVTNVMPTHMFESQMKLNDGTMSYLSDHVGLKITFSLF